MLHLLSQSILWEEAATTGQVPAPRSGHSFSTVGGRHFLFGGAGRQDGTTVQLTALLEPSPVYVLTPCRHLSLT